MEKIASRFKSKLVKMIKDSGGKFDKYSTSPKIRQIKKRKFVVIFSH